LVRDGIGGSHKVCIGPRIFRIESVDCVHPFEIEIEGLCGVDPVHFEIQIGGKSNLVSCGAPNDGTVEVIEGADLKTLSCFDIVKGGGGIVESTLGE
jgi:hypothetical protein